DDNKNGLALLPAVLKTHLPVDVLILMLGSNDMKLRFHRNAADIARCVGRLVHSAQVTSAEKMGKPCEILLVSPPHIGDRVAELGCGEEFGTRCIEISHQLADKYRAVANKYGVHFLDAAQVTGPSDIDCLHLSPEGHTAMAQALCAACREIAGES
ncbi:MAG: GDSL-type esterase/lipase family protein, partial [Butyricicoccaceae bacterium]